MAKEYKDLVVGLYIGTAKVMAVVAEILPTGELKLVGLGGAPSNGLKRGVVVNKSTPATAAIEPVRALLGVAFMVASAVIVDGAVLGVIASGRQLESPPRSPPPCPPLPWPP